MNAMNTMNIMRVGRFDLKRKKYLHLFYHLLRLSNRNYALTIRGIELIKSIAV